MGKTRCSFQRPLFLRREPQQQLTIDVMGTYSSQKHKA